MQPRTRRIGSLLLAGVAALAVGAATADIIATGEPQPASFAAGVMLSALAIAWPLATAGIAWDHVPLCRGCHGPAFGFGEFGFCTRCGSTRVIRKHHHGVPVA